MKAGYLVDEPAPGKYLPADSAAKLPASKFYLPDDLPPALDLPLNITEAHGRAMHSLGRLDGFLSEVNDPGAVLELFIYKEAEQSSQVEGTQVTVADMLREDSDSKDVREARNYARALRDAADGLGTAGRAGLSNDLVRSLHATLMEVERTDDEVNPGAFREQYVWIEEAADVGRQVRFVPPKAEIAARKMDDFEAYLQTGGQYPSLIDNGILHYQFETIHPFIDGNGRVGRLLVVLLLIADDVLGYPFFYLSSYIRRHKDRYADLLLAVSEENRWEDWLRFFLDGLREQADEAFSRAKLLFRLRDQYRSRYETARPTVRESIEALFEEPLFTVPRLADRIGRSVAATNTAVTQLEADGVIRETTGQERYREFQADAVLGVLNQSIDELPTPGELISEQEQ